MTPLRWPMPVTEARRSASSSPGRRPVSASQGEGSRTHRREGEYLEGRRPRLAREVQTAVERAPCSPRPATDRGQRISLARRESHSRCDIGRHPGLRGPDGEARGLRQGPTTQHAACCSRARCSPGRHQTLATVPTSKSISPRMPTSRGTASTYRHCWSANRSCELAPPMNWSRGC